MPALLARHRNHETPGSRRPGRRPASAAVAARTPARAARGGRPGAATAGPGRCGARGRATGCSGHLTHRPPHIGPWWASGGRRAALTEGSIDDQPPAHGPRRLLVARPHRLDLRRRILGRIGRPGRRQPSAPCELARAVIRHKGAEPRTSAHQGAAGLRRKCLGKPGRSCAASWKIGENSRASAAAGHRQRSRSHAGTGRARRAAAAPFGASLWKLETASLRENKGLHSSRDQPPR
jgi:hypothetical protein